MLIGTSAIRQHADGEKKKREEEERNERGTDVTGNLVNVDYRGCSVQRAFSQRSRVATRMTSI